MKSNWPSQIRSSSEKSSFRSFLAQQFKSRKAKNPSYSLRSFARQLGLDHSTLSQILRGKRTLTDKNIVRIGEKLGLQQPLIASYLSPILQKKWKLKNLNWKAKPLSLEAFEIISDWHHYAILELTRLVNFKADTRWIAKALGITIEQANIAISKLTHLKLLEMADHRLWVDHSGNISMTHADLTEVALKKIHREIHELAIEAIDKVSLGARDQSSMTVAINTKQLPQLIELISHFKKELEELIEQDEKRDDVYQIEVSVFPLTTFKHTTKEE